MSSVPILFYQSKAYDLLYGMANPKNLQVISGKLLERAIQTDDDDLRRNLVMKLIELCDRFSSQIEWYIRTMNEVCCFYCLFLTFNLCKSVYIAVTFHDLFLWRCQLNFI